MARPMSADDLFRAGDPDEIRALAGEQYYKHAGDGYLLGGRDANPNDVAGVLLGELLVPARDPNSVAVYRMPDGRAILVSREDDGLRAVELLPDSALDTMVRPAGQLWDDQEYEALQLATERAAVAGGLEGPLDRVLGGPENDSDGVDREAEPMEGSVPEGAAAGVVRDLLSERAETKKSHPETSDEAAMLDEETARRVLDTLQERDLAEDPDRTRPATEEEQRRRKEQLDRRTE